MLLIKLSCKINNCKKKAYASCDKCGEIYCAQHILKKKGALIPDRPLLTMEHICEDCSNADA